jgi:hypothetical protein
MNPNNIKNNFIKKYDDIISNAVLKKDANNNVYLLVIVDNNKSYNFINKIDKFNGLPVKIKYNKQLNLFNYDLNDILE